MIPEGKKRCHSTPKWVARQHNTLPTDQQPPKILQWDGLSPVQKSRMGSTRNQCHGPMYEIQVREGVTDVGRPTTRNDVVAIRQGLHHQKCLFAAAKPIFLQLFLGDELIFCRGRKTILVLHQLEFAFGVGTVNNRRQDDGIHKPCGVPVILDNLP